MSVGMIKYYWLAAGIVSFLPIVIYWLVGLFLYLNLVISGKMGNKNDLVITVLLLTGAIGITGLISSIRIFGLAGSSFISNRITFVMLFVGLVVLTWQFVRANSLGSDWFVLVMFGIPILLLFFLLKLHYNHF